MRALFHSIFRSYLSLAGAVLTTASAFMFALLYLLEWLDVAGGGPYSGLILFVALPAVFVIGLALIPLGWFLHRRARKKAHPDAKEFPVVDLNRPRVRSMVLAIAGLTTANVLFLSVGTYKGVHAVESNEFCGETCHSVMAPEYAAYAGSSHASVKCVACHVGDGAQHFAQAKLSGVRQLVALAAGNYHRPIETPVRNLHAGKDTCGHCHAADRYLGDKLRIVRKFDSDEANTAKVTVLMMKNGGQRDGAWSGNHFHAGANIRYLAGPDRKKVYAVERIEADGAKKVFATQEPPEAGAAWRTMDCVDCHNRVGHDFKVAERAVDAALADGRISTELPFARREVLAAVQAAYPTRVDGVRAVEKAVRDFYAAKHPDAKPAAVDRAATHASAIYARSVFPEMKVGFGTYADLKSHEGCYRCHDNEHLTADGAKISKGCETCHQALATDEVAPEVLDVLYP